MAKKGPHVRASKRGKTGNVATSRKVEPCETKPKSDHPLEQRLVTDNPLLYSTLRGKVQGQCKQMPEGKRFQPGNTAGAAGRPSSKVLTQTVKEMLAETDPRTHKTIFQRLIENARRLALQGSYRHLELLLAYGLGRPLQQQINLNADVPAGEEADREIQEALAAIRGEN